MPELSNQKTIKDILDRYGFQFKKSLGQNFLIDSTVCPRMADAAIENGESCALEIGPGIGVLTSELASRTEKTVALEIDERLRAVLAETLKEHKNAEIIFSDVLKTDVRALIKEKFGDSKVAVCANLPYYITSPVIMYLLGEHLPITSLTVMVQKEAAERLCAEIGSRDSGAVTYAVSYYAEPEILFNVPRSSFMPSPNVDSAVIRLKIRKNPPVHPNDEKFMFSLIKAAFSMRRKTLLNGFASMGIPKDTTATALNSLGISEQIRGEKLTLQDYADLSDILK